MKPHLFRTMASAILMASFFSSSVSAADLKIGLIDTQKILQESNAARKAREAIVKELKDKQAVYQGKERDVLAMQEALKRDRNTLSSEEAGKRQLDLSRSIKELGRLKTDLEEELNRKNRELTARILQEVSDVVEAFRSAEKYTLILEKSNVVTADPAVDVTPRIIQLYDQKKP